MGVNTGSAVIDAQLASQQRRPHCMVRTVPLLFAIVALGCGSTVSPSGTEFATTVAGSAVSTLIADLTRAGASVTELGPFNTDPLGGRGARLCVEGQELRAYVFDSDAEASAIATTIDPTDPSKIGRGLIVEWAGNPKFWQRGPLVLLYLGSNAAVEGGIATVVGPPFAAGRGRDPGAAAHAC